ncbi:hypothetical protein NDU88_003500 [Pleurodeles waltl]|uniref:Uncharacterized protein n=1 Tax=Pleurodeles waltl TaxID=8319 RepID=A0AAV7MUS1_PLEWA|nr:hypothetical protein NDU88_003500 [Pleurodeles waltl]
MVNISRDYLAPDVGFAQRASVGPTSSAELIVQIAASVLKDHEYDTFFSLEGAGSLPRLFIDTLEIAESESSHSLESEHTNNLKPSGKRKRQSNNLNEDSQTQKTLSIIHPRSTEWIPYADVAHYVQDRIRKGLERMPGQVVGHTWSCYKDPRTGGTS